jgi:hypothetical protein
MPEKLKMYRSWYLTAGRWVTTIGYFESREDAEGSLPSNRSAASPEVGVEEIEVIMRNTRPDIRRETIEELLRDILTFDFIKSKWEGSVNSIKMDHCQISGTLHALRKGVRAFAEDQP